MKAFPMEFRQRVVELSGKGWTTKEIQQALGVSRAWVDSIKRLQKNGKSLEIKSSANYRTSLAERHGDRIQAQVERRSGTGRTSHSSGRSGRSSGPGSTRTGSSSSTRPSAPRR